MDDQTKIDERNGTPNSASKGFARGLGTFAHDVLTLADLQAQLFAADMRECRQRVMAPLLVLFCGVAMSLACFPVALAALALFLVQVFQTSYAAGFLIAFGAGAVLGILLSAVGWRKVSQRASVLMRSQHELIRNLRWIKEVLDRSRT